MKCISENQLTVKINIEENKWQRNKYLKISKEGGEKRMKTKTACGGGIMAAAPIIGAHRVARGSKSK